MLKEKKNRKHPIWNWDSVDDKTKMNEFVQKELLRELKEDGVVEYQNYYFKNWDFSFLSLANCHFSNCIFEFCDFSNQNMEASAFLEVEFIGCKWMGSSFANALFRDVLFQDCDLHYATFFTVKWIRTEFIACNLANSYLADSHFIDCTLSKSSLEESDILHVSFCDMDLSTCILRGVRLTLDCLKGAIVSEEQAIAFSKLLGLCLKEE